MKNLLILFLSSLIIWGCEKSDSNEPLKNNTPIAIISIDTLVYSLGDTINLDGHESYDIENNALTYYWELIFKPDLSQCTIINKDCSESYFKPDIDGNYSIRLTVVDEMNDSSVTEVSLNVIITCNSYDYLNLEDFYKEDFSDIVVWENNIDGWETLIDNWFNEEGYIRNIDGTIEVYSGDGISSITKYFDELNVESVRFFFIEFKFINFYRSQYAGFGMSSAVFHKNSEFELVIGDSKVNIRPGTEEEYWNDENLFSFSNKDIRLLIDPQNESIIACYDKLNISNEFAYATNEQSINYVKITSNKANYDMEPFYLTTSTIIDYLNIYTVK